MLDKFNREINYLRVSITDRCNLRCSYCRPKEGISLQGHEDILRYEEIIRIVSIAVKMGLVKVRVTGGEPLVRRGFVDFLADLKKISGLRDISLTTNGILLEQFAQNIYDAGVSRINISLDSLNKDKYFRITRGGNLDDVLRGIARAEEVGFFPIKINTVAIKGFNDDEAADFVRLAAEKPFQVRFIELMPVGHTNLDYGEDYMPTWQLIEQISRHYELEPVKNKRNKSDGPAKIFKIKGGLGEIGFINPVSDHFCSTCNRMRLTSDGKLRVCLLNEAEIDLKKALRENCSDAELEKLIRDAVLLKPKQHDLICTDNSVKKCYRNMSEIGG
ncbi:MAG: GTP 3',8-cyclase MoaA [Deltaproteobacteria bacterium HGW-Deltaproteobacteria-13]|jgi:cyclic pyranopterin phosphate synthase|nr:MAG: GTP 3',8-cyclase MoaA [Deltaproteobacteria bacterium HGW-Deltaproteobacteria-13]